MFGYVICTKSELTKEENARYQSVYCGLCRELKNKYGPVARLCLNYDLTFLALFLTALYEPEEKTGEIRCLIHPKEKRPTVSSRFVEYAADMTIMLTYFQCMDDWNDEKKRAKLALARRLERFLPEIKKKYPRQYRVVESKIEELSALEKETANVSDAIVKCSGDLLGEIFVYDEKDFWSTSLRKFGYELGRFIYLMDAVIDYESDLKSGNFNPFIKMDFDRDHAKEVLNVMIGSAVEEFERLPIVQDERIFKNILYSGIWTQYNVKIAGKETKK